MGVPHNKGAHNMALKRADPHAAYVCHHRGEPDVLAANGHVLLAELSADEESDTGPLYHAWALHKAFLAGAAWQRKSEERE